MNLATHLLAFVRHARTTDQPFNDTMPALSRRPLRAAINAANVDGWSNALAHISAATYR